MLQIYCLNSNMKIEEIITCVKEYKAIVLRAELCLLKDFLGFCNRQAKQDFLDKTNIANQFELQWILRVACKKNIGQALDFTKPKNTKIAIVSEKAIPGKIIGKIGTALEFENTDEMIEKISQEFGITKAAKDKYPLEKLLIEKSLMEISQ
ncbi:hypothetical protein HY989_01825 [Candidatus Micrarchaeota archaeon]|nr:hypothetical protein [Candidatus Micrarchaeota archaeon]